MLLIALLLWVLAGVFWQMAGPPVQHGNLVMPVSAPANVDYRPAGLQRWFDATTAHEATPALDDLSVLAVVSGSRGVALLRWAQASSVAARVGEEFRPGSRLLAVSASGVVVEQGGMRSTLLLPQSNVRGASIVPVGASGAVLTPPVTEVATDSEPKGAALELSRGQLSSGMQGGNLAGWDKGIASYREGGIAIEDASQQVLASIMQLRNGDVMKKVNGKELRQLEDISLLYNQLSQQAAVEVTVLRDGALQTLHYKINP